MSTLLAATAIGVYVLIVGGATAALTEAVQACPSWPLCHGPISLSEPALLVAWGHRITAAIVGVLLVLTTAVLFMYRSETRQRVLAMVGFVFVLFPVQMAVGAVVVMDGPTPTTTGAHLVVGMTIFAALMLALAWELETDAAAAATTGTDQQPNTAADLPPHDDAAKPPGLDPRVSDRPPLTSAKETVVAYLRLTKPRLMWLLCLVAAAGMALAAGPALSVRTVVLTLAGGVLAIGASGTFNHVLERDRDKRMHRTQDRPTATRQIPLRNATLFGVVLAVLSLAVFVQVNLLTAALGLVAILFYSVIYTLVLKPHTVHNTLIGGFAGALPALIGWAAVTGRLALPGVALAIVIFLWTPAHFYNLALAYKEDYARGGFPMLPVVRGEATTRTHIVLYLAATLLAAVVLAAVTDLGLVYAGTTSAFGALFLWTVLRLHRERDEAAAFRAFHASNAYLGAILLAIVIDALAV